MGSFEENIKNKVLTSGKNDPKATDLDYYSKPENYTGSNLQSLQKFKQDKTKEDNANKKIEKKLVVKDAKYHFFHRYKHLLHDAIFLQDLLDREKEPDSEDEEEMERMESSTKEGQLEPELLCTITEEDRKRDNDTDLMETESCDSIRSKTLKSPDVGGY